MVFLLSGQAVPRILKQRCFESESSQNFNGEIVLIFMADRIPSKYEQIYKIVRLIPPGKIATYGQIATLIEQCTPRMVGYAMAATPDGKNIPWHRVINSQGKVSKRSGGDGEKIQQILLEAEGVKFNKTGRVNLSKVKWEFPVLT